MKTIHKFNLSEATEHSMPKGAQIVHVHEQRDDVCIWAAVDEAEPHEIRRFRMYSTGEELDLDAERYWLHYLGTAHLMDGGYVLHVFEEIAISDGHR